MMRGVGRPGVFCPGGGTPALGLFQVLLIIINWKDRSGWRDRRSAPAQGWLLV